jgi:hypothetical protein
MRELIAAFAKPLTAIALIFFIGFSLYWYWHIPTMGKGIGMLGAVAAVMALRGEIHGSEKVLWIIVIFGLLYVEVRAINKDAKDREGERTAANIVLTGIVRNLTDVIAENQAATDRNQVQFQTMMNRFGENTKMVTGGDSFCYLDIALQGSNNIAGADVMHIGKYPLRGVTMRVFDHEKSRVAVEQLMKNRNPSQVDSGEVFRALDVGSSRQSVPDFATTHRFIGGYPTVAGKSQSMDISFAAFNGGWLERLEARNIDGKWMKAIMVEFGEPGRKPFFKIDPAYPRKNGKLDVPWPVPVKGKPEWEQ